ncbi:MAG TPA: Xaa-Pro peptidase family protein [Herpetosiphonaceae bacterium]|nr:Xaa-Pro peptidase family protein [Herpetosiphonaceae bacterium]
MPTRHELLIRAMRTAGLDAVALVPGANLYYMLGLTIHSSERLAVALLGTDGSVRVVLPALEQPRAESEARLPARFYPWKDAEGYAAALTGAVVDAGLAGRLGVEYTAMRVLELRAIEAVSKVEVVDATGPLAELRMVKDAGELAAMRRAVRIVEEALEKAIAAIRPGVTETEIATTWDRAMEAAGAQTSFTTIVASGPNSANPHHTTGDRRIEVGDLVILDGGARIDGYCSDITRTVAVGALSAEGRAIYEFVLQANRAGVAAVRPEVSGADIDAAAREVIERGGYGQYFIHRTGHGLGIEIHEPPYLHSAEEEPLPEGATFTVEPGIYLPGIGGVRIEDDVVLTHSGGECLTSLPRELRILSG